MDMNRIAEHFNRKPNGTLNVFCTAGFPGLTDIVPIVRSLQNAGVDMVEIGMPFSDPTADGPTIQYSNKIALDNGMHLAELFRQLRSLREEVTIPVLLMGYLNPALQFGFEKFLDECAACGIDGLILPDLPIREYADLYRPSFELRGLSNIFLVTPQTHPDRIRHIDELSDGFIYLVSTYATTGGKAGFEQQQVEYFERIQAMDLENPTLIGFGIRDRAGFERACRYANGAIIGSAFIKAIDGSTNVEADSAAFVKVILDGSSDH
jgi:tryptophan synthase alpha chain